jgi:amino acid adenylation domain-containing protein
LIGFFLNSLALRSQVRGDASFLTVLQAVKNTTLDAYEHQDLPFEKVVEALGVERSRSRNAIFQVWLVLQNMPEADELKLGDVQLIRESSGIETSPFDLNLEASETKEGLRLSLTYCRDLYREDTIHRMLGHYSNLLEAILSDATVPVDRLAMLPADELLQVREIFNDTFVAFDDTSFAIDNTESGFKDKGVDYSSGKTIISLFEEQADRTPDAIALLFGEDRMSYRELDERSNQLAYYLADKDVQKEALVGLCIDRGFPMLIGILGILKAGGAYVPLDPAYPEERLQYMVEDSGCRLVITMEQYRDLLPDSAAVVYMDKGWSVYDHYPRIRFERNNMAIGTGVANGKRGTGGIVRADSLAYVIYTSGSTGRPKGVLIEHGSVVNLIRHQRHFFGIEDIYQTGKDDGSGMTERILQFSNFCFDASVEQIFLALLNGATLVLMPKELQLDLYGFEKMLHDQQVTHLHATPGFLDLVNPGIYGGLKRVVAGGEACSPLLVQKWRGLVNFYNKYGPTETTVTAVEWQAPAGFGDNSGCQNSVVHGANGQSGDVGDIVPIGRPVANTRVYIVDKAGGLSGIGIAGELYIGGVQVGRGYLNREQLTVERFVTDQFSAQGGQKLNANQLSYAGQVLSPGGRLYRTGDKARWLPDGNLEYLGRLDDQVKIRGYRIELGEIEQVLRQAPGVRQGVILLKEDEQYGKLLIGYVLPVGDFDKPAIIAWLQQQLPEYMVPGILIEIDRVPLTVNGKTDKKRLLELMEAVSAERVYEGPRNAMEATMVAIWEELLEESPVGINSNFFELGGHSLLAVRVVAAIRNQLGLELSVVTLFDYPTIAQISAQLELNGNDQLLPAIGRYEKEGPIPLSFSQERLWFIDKLQGSVQYHMPRIFRLTGSLDIPALEASFREIVNRHEIFRTVIKETDGIGYQQINPAGEWKMTYIRQEEILASGGSVDAYIYNELLSRPYDLSTDSMLKTILIRTAEDDHTLVVLLHHIAFDGWSLSVMGRELSELYNCFSRGMASSLKELPVQYADYSIWQRKYLTGEGLENLLSYWKQKLTGVEKLDLPTDFIRPSVQSTRGSTIGFKIDNELKDQLDSLSLQQGVTFFMTVSAVFKVLLHRYTGQEDICIGTPVANRVQGVTESLMGFFVNTLALRDDLSGDPSFGTLLQRVKSTALEAYARQDTPFEKIVEEVAGERNMSHTPLFQVLFVLQNTPEVADLNFSGIEFAPVNFDNTTSKFDLYFNLVEAADGLYISIEYCTDLFRAETIERMFDHFRLLLHSAVKNPAKKISQLEMYAPGEKRQLKEFNATEEDFPGETSIVSMFEAQAKNKPMAPAIVFENVAISYAALNEKANHVAGKLIGLGVREDVLVALCAERSIEMIVGVLAILKAGGAYVPVDPEYPKERIELILKDSTAEIVLTTRKCSQVVKGVQGRTILEIDDIVRDWVSNKTAGNPNPGISISPESLVYVIYTSGSTGRPKGVELPHRALHNMLQWQDRHMGQERQTGKGRHAGAETTKRILQFASLNFDVSAQEIFSALCFGHSLHLIEENRRKDMHEVFADINRQQITQLFVPFVVLQNLAEHATRSGEYPLSLQEIFTAGEQLKLTDDIKNLVEKTGVRLYNQYGPSEAHVVSCYEVKESDFRDRVLPPIGQPIANTFIHITGIHGELCGIGIPGQLCIGGVQVGRGYFNQAELTAEKFIPDLLSGKDSCGLYCTGDKARWLPDGNIEFMGRIDDQVKIRGYRIELGEVETFIQQAPGIKQAVVMAKADQQGIKRLVAYVVSDGELNRTALHDYLKEWLPGYMIPGIIIGIEKIPINANGKADKKRLPEIDPSLLPSRRYEAPRNETEERVVSIWQELLGIKNIGIYDNFFEIGGHSLLVTRMASAIRKEFELEISVKTFFQLATPESIAGYIELNLGQIAYDADAYESIKL